jgi:hypothetical protein
MVTRGSSSATRATSVRPATPAEGRYASKGAHVAREAWFRDSEGNMLGLVQFVL